jgi:uncharacterized protein (TIGR04540 family)
MSSKEIATAIKNIIDDYWAGEIAKEAASKKIETLLEARNNRVKIIRGEEKTAGFKRILGVKRLITFDELYRYSWGK